MLRAHWYNHAPEYGLTVEQNVFVYGDGIYNTDLQLPDGIIFKTIFFYNFQQFQTMYRPLKPPKKVRIFKPTE